MKWLIILLCLITYSFSQTDSLKVAVDDWNYVQDTYHKTDSTLIETQKLVKLYEQRIEYAKMEINTLRQSYDISSSVIEDMKSLDNIKSEQIDILKSNKKSDKWEIWTYRVMIALLSVKLIMG